MLSGASIENAKRTVEMFSGQSWEQVDRKRLASYSLVMLELNEEWFAYYLPALLVSAVDMAHESPGGSLGCDLHDHLNRLLCSDGGPFELCFHSRKSYFSAHQQGMILQAAEYLDGQKFTEGLSLCIRQKMNEPTFD